SFRDRVLGHEAGAATGGPLPFGDADQPDLPATRTRLPMTAVVEVTGATVAYDRAPVLTGVDLRVEPGEVVAILGANGSGKSTLVKAILGLAPLVAGSVRLFG